MAVSATGFQYPIVKTAMGVDSGEGTADTAWSVIDEKGLIELVSIKTPNTYEIGNRTLGLMRQYGISSDRIVFDRGGGGLQHADRLRAEGYGVRTVGFGESVGSGIKRGYTSYQEKAEVFEDRAIYRDRRTEMYWKLSQLLKPVLTDDGKWVSRFGIPSKYTELRKQLAVMPRRYDDEGIAYMPPKGRKDEEATRRGVKSLMELLGGESPDEADSLVLAVHGLYEEPPEVVVGAYN